MSQIKRVGITGASGFIGSLLTKMIDVPTTSQYDILTGQDITQTSTQMDCVASSDVIVHLAAISGLKACEDNKDYATLLNTEATVNLAHKAKDAGVRRFIFPSSSAVYGESQDFRMTETHLTDPRSHYGVTKLYAEQIMKLADRHFEVVILRKSNLYGYGMVWKGITVIDKFLEKYLAHEPLPITGTGSQRRDFVHVVDVAGLYAKLAKATKVRSGIYNIGGGECISIRELAEMVNDCGEAILGYRVGLDFKPATSEALWHDFTYDFSKAQREFQFKPSINIKFYIQERLLKHLRERP